MTDQKFLHRILNINSIEPIKIWFPIVISILSMFVAIQSCIQSHQQHDLAKDIAHKQLRAYINIVGDHLETLDVHNDTLIARINLVNSGNTPAFGVTFNLNSCDDSTGILTDVAHIWPSGYPATVGAGSLVPITFEFHLFPNIYNTFPYLRYDKDNWLALGVHYKDIYGYEHRTCQLWQYIPRTNEINLIRNICD